MRMKMVELLSKYSEEWSSLLVGVKPMLKIVWLSFWNQECGACLRSYITLHNLQTWFWLGEAKPKG